MNIATAADTAVQQRVACFGRFMIDLPPAADVGGFRSAFMFGGISAERVSIDLKGFEARMAQREAKVKADGFKRVYDWSRTINPSPAARIFVGSREAFGRTAYAYEMHALVHDLQFSMSESAYSPKNIDTVLSKLQTEVIKALRARGPDEIPTDPGLCIKHGFIASDGNERAGESVEISLDFKRWPDMELTIGSQMVYKAEPPLLDRVNNAKVPVEYLPHLRHIKTIRKGRRDVGDYTGEELLEMFPSDGGYMTHMFRWESHFELNDPFKPMLVVELTTGRISQWMGKRPTISEQEAVELFDAVVNSIRLRLTTPAKPAPEPNAALGTPLMTGRTCPQNGLWEAEDGGRRYFSEGDTLPAIRVAGKPSFIERLRGTQPLERRATLWTLVAYGPDPAPEQDPAAGSGPAADDPSSTPERS